MRPLLHLLTLGSPALAHFSLNHPASRGKNSETQDQSPCGGKNTPSSSRTKWPIKGGQLSFEAGHDEALTAVYLGLGDNPKAEDFTITLAHKFLQIGLGTFCWNQITIPGNLSVKNGDKATIQVVQSGHSGGGLYNCADIEFTEAEVRVAACQNGTGVTAEAAADDHNDHDDDDDDDKDGDDKDDDLPASTASSALPTTTASNSESGAGAVAMAGAAMFAGVLGVLAWVGLV